MFQQSASQEVLELTRALKKISRRSQWQQPSAIPTIGRAVRDRLPEGKMTWKKMTRPAGEKFTRDNQVGYFNRLLRLVGLVKCQLSFNIKNFKRK